MANLQLTTSFSENQAEKRDNVDSDVATLPEDILKHVFNFLPIKKAIQTSIVAKTFKTSWSYNKKLLFGSDFFLKYNQEEHAALIDRVFESHKGTEIQSFRLYIDPIGVQTLIQKWLQICVYKGIEDLELDFYRPGLLLGSDFINGFKELKNLKMINCEIELPRDFNGGIQFLKTLTLWKLELTEEMVEQLVSNCRMLQCLDLFRVTNINQLNIRARNHKHFKVLKVAICPDLLGIEIDSPTLRSIFYAGKIPRIRFTQGMELDEAFFNLQPSRPSYVQNTHEVEILVNDLQTVRVLTTSALFLEALTTRVRDGVFREAEYCLVNLRELQLLMEHGMYCNPYDILVFLRNCPSMERLFIDLNDYYFECGMYWELHQLPILKKFNHYFDQLRIVRLMGFKFLPSELEFVKILLHRARFLVQLVIVTPYNRRTKILPHEAQKYSKLLNDWKASPSTKILFYVHCNDKNYPKPSHPRDWY